MSEEIVNLDNCAREPIHVPGAIQPHGLMFVLREPELTVVQVSENVGTLLGREVEEILDHDLSSFLDAAQINRVQFALDSVDPRDHNPVELQIPTDDPDIRLDGFVHRHDGFSLLELEPASLSYNARFLNFYKMISKLTTRLHNTPSLEGLLQEAVNGVRELTNFDRVMMYRFAANFEGEVVAEARAEEVEPYLGLWFPASDIPEQARNLYVLNPVRVISDSNYSPVPLYPAINPDTHRPTDLSFAGLRSVSPIHCEYLRNMGVAASMSVSIVRDGRLWGLVACHHFSSKLVPYELRKACVFIGEVLSSEIARREVEEESVYHSRATATQAKFLELMASTSNPLLGLIQSSPNLLDLIPSEGAAVIVGDKAHMLGSTPAYSELMKLVDLLHVQEVPSTFVTRSLRNVSSSAESMRATASGVIALEVSQEPRSYVIFFRPEVAQTVSWGGNPEKPVVATEDGFRLGPRRSFEIWREELSGYSLPWTPAEVRAASELRKLISVVTYGKDAASA